MSKIYVLNEARDYEGEVTLGVFSSIASAWAQVLRHAEFFGRDIAEPERARIEADCGSTQYVIYEMTLDEAVKL